MLLPSTNEAGALAVAQTIHATLAGLAIVHDASPHRVVSVSIGAAAMRPHLQPGGSEKLVRAANRALYAAKSAGRNGTARAESGTAPTAPLRPAPVRQTVPATSP